MPVHFGGKHACVFSGEHAFMHPRKTYLYILQKKNMPACSVEKTCPCFPLKNMPVTACSLENMPVKKIHTYCKQYIMCILGLLLC